MVITKEEEPMTRTIEPDAEGGEVSDRRALVRMIFRMRGNLRRPKRMNEAMLGHATALLEHLTGGAPDVTSSRMVMRVGYSPGGELTDHYAAARILARIRNGSDVPRAVMKQLLFHAVELLKLFADDPTLGVIDPTLEAEAEKERQAAEVRRKVKEERKRDLDAAVEKQDRQISVRTAPGRPTRAKSRTRRARLNETRGAA